MDIPSHTGLYKRYTVLFPVRGDSSGDGDRVQPMVLNYVYDVGFFIQIAERRKRAEEARLQYERELEEQRLDYCLS